MNGSLDLGKMSHTPNQNFTNLLKSGLPKEVSPRKADTTLSLLERIRQQKNKKRRGKYNKNEALYEFIDYIH